MENLREVDQKAIAAGDGKPNDTHQPLTDEVEYRKRERRTQNQRSPLRARQLLIVDEDWW